MVPYMSIYGYIWVYMGIYGYIWVYIGIYGYIWGIYRYVWAYTSISMHESASGIDFRPLKVQVWPIHPKRQNCRNSTKRPKANPKLF